MRLLPGILLLGQNGLGFEQQFASSTAESVRDAQDHGECWHVFTTLDFSHVRPFDACLVGQCFLSDAICRSHGSHNGAKRKGWLDLKCRCPKGPSSPSDLLLHGQKARI